MKRKCSACFGVAVGIGVVALVAAGVVVFKALRNRRRAAEKPAATETPEVSATARPPAAEPAAAGHLVS